MKEYSIDRVKNNIHNKIGYDNYLSEEYNRKKNIKRSIFTLVFIASVLVSGVTVNAITEGGVVDLVKRIIFVNGKETEAIDYKDPYAKAYECDKDGNCIELKQGVIEYKNFKLYYNDGDTFDKIEFRFNEKNNPDGFHIVGTDYKGEHFDYNIDFTDDSVPEVNAQDEMCQDSNGIIIKCE